ncbi:hypothetical protein EJB05_14617, partial [Eragrostis curvula]
MAIIVKYHLGVALATIAQWKEIRFIGVCSLGAQPAHTYNGSNRRVLLRCKRNKKSEAEVPSIRRTELCPSAPRRYCHNELAVATQGFANEVKIGRGGFGPVYRGYLGDQDRDVAIKVLSQGSSVQGVKEYEAEVRVMTRLRHRNIVELIGWCDDGPNRDLLLVYEFVLNGSLDKHLYDPHRRVLTWSDR